MTISFFNAAIKTVLTALTFLTVANSVQAAPPFTGMSSGTWDIPTPFAPPIVYTGVGTNTLTWGNPGSFGTGPNSLSFVGNAFSTNVNTPFKVGNLTYFNGTTVPGTSPDSLPLNVQLAFIDPSGLKQNFNFLFNRVSTLNIGTPDQNADFVFLPNSFSNTSFNFSGQEYTLQLLGFSQDNGTNLVNQFHIWECDTDTAALYARITVIPRSTPEPSNIQAVLSIAGLGVVVNLRKKLVSAVKA